VSPAKTKSPLPQNPAWPRLLIALFPSFWPVMGAQVLIGGTSSVFIPAICAMSLGIVGRLHSTSAKGATRRSTRRAT
jgi:predicted MFS family arabinose efflux permease